ncbi:MAG: hypothetical protein PWR20_1000 [Bacteroidales bacterium]|jgi:hypothetical protein|nr:hypothetical protein [Bacteroidales bacterium]MDN5328321.1 hypothetical protein [Bacteroidales bacterium]
MGSADSIFASPFYVLNLHVCRNLPVRRIMDGRKGNKFCNFDKKNRI